MKSHLLVLAFIAFTLSAAFGAKRSKRQAGCTSSTQCLNGGTCGPSGTCSCMNLYGGPFCQYACSLIDMGLVLDATDWTTSANFPALIQFAKDFVSKFTIGLPDVRVSLGVMGQASMTVDTSLNQANSLNTVLLQISNVAFRGGGLNFTVAMGMSANNMYTTVRGMRDNVARNLVVLTSGRNSAFIPQVIKNTMASKGIKVYVMGIGPNVDYNELVDMAGDPTRVLLEPNWPSISGRVDQLRDMVCQTVAVNECVSNPCQNGGVCTDMTNAYKCTCASGIVGTNCDTTCPNLDIGLVVNQTSSQGANWNLTVDFLIKFALSLNIGPTQTKVGLVKYSIQATTKFNLNTYLTQGSLLNAISTQRSEYGGGYTNTSGGLMEAYNTLFSLNGGDRSNIPSVCILFTDGKSDRDAAMTLPTAQLLQNAGVTVFVLAAGPEGNLNRTENSGIASWPNTTYVTELKDLAELPMAADAFITKVCKYYAASSCSPNPCLNGASCSISAGTPICACLPGYTGPQCQTDIDECFSAPCINGGTCKNGVNQYTCICPVGYGGLRCETPGGTTLPTPITNACSYVDLCLIIDASASIQRQNFDKVLAFLNSFIDFLDIGTTAAQVGVLVYSSNTTHHLWLNQATNKNTAKTFIASTPYLERSSLTDVGLNDARTVCFDYSRGNRGAAKDVALLVTDSASPSPQLTKMAADALISNAVDLYALGYSTYDLAELMDIVGPGNGNRVFTSPDASSLPNQLEAMLNNICQIQLEKCSPNPPTCFNGGYCLDTPSGFMCLCPSGYIGPRCDIPPMQYRTCDYVDICFMVDSSASIRPNNWIYVLQFLQQFTAQLEISPAKVQVGVVTYSNDAVVNFDLTVNKDYWQLNTSIFQIPYLERSGYSDYAFEACRKQVFNTAGDRLMARNIAILITEGAAADWLATIDQAKQMLNEGVDIYAVGYGAYSMDELQAIVNYDSSKVFDCFFPYTLLMIVEWTLQGICSINTQACKSSPCSNGGSCYPTKGGYRCSCPQLLIGTNCETAISPCLSSPCMNAGTCFEKTNTTYYCRCPYAWVGVNCEFPNPCLSTPCKYGGTCQGSNTGFTCTCPLGYNGTDCSNVVDPCLQLPCLYNGTCIVAGQTYQCICPLGTTGTRCEINFNDCFSNPCKNGATCLDGVNQYSCQCVPGFTGIYCTTDIDECASTPCQYDGTCLDGVNAYLCQCMPGITGASCETPLNLCVSYPCMNGGSCFPTPGTYVCMCPSGYNGTQCELNVNECLAFPCQNNGTCVDAVGTYICVCNPGLTGKNCETNIDDCASAPCINGATCIDRYNAYTCSCPQLFTGSVCQTQMSACGSGPCQNNGTCADVGLTYVCTCKPGTTGVNCETDLDECLSDPCQNNGTCTDMLGSFMCNCSYPYSGALCDQAADNCVSSPCTNGGTCVSSLALYTCSCKQGFTGVTCTQDVNECLSYPCQNAGLCQNKVGYYNCICLAGTSGVNCETDFDECASTPCQNGGTCIDQLNRYLCGCDTGFTGLSCESSYDPCVSNPCLNGGSCTNSANLIQCNCGPGFTGTTCETDVDECLSNPCQNGGTCQNNLGYFTCACPPGASGGLCESDADECLSSPCQNGGTCNDLLNTYTCSCAVGFTGMLCQTSFNPCLSSPCQNGGVCVGTGVLCNCPPTYTGTMCETPFVDTCLSNPCLNGATCQTNGISHTCTCAPGFTGPICETAVSVCISTPCMNGGTCMDNAGGTAYICNCPSSFTGTHCELNAGYVTCYDCMSSGTVCGPAQITVPGPTQANCTQGCYTSQDSNGDTMRGCIEDLTFTFPTQIPTNGFQCHNDGNSTSICGCYSTLCNDYGALALPPPGSINCQCLSCTAPFQNFNCLPTPAFCNCVGCQCN